ncbi:MAG TPA: hypothetical protein VFU89_04830 [Rhabdochlamydiaceae bacterium]|nr:hypothetical protein [Rhabdochlamydiaceae bacterium]
MSFLPFVLSFLLILVLGSSFLFTSFRSTAVEKTVILAKHRAKLGLITKQAEAEYKKGLTKQPKSSNPTPKGKDQRAVYQDQRNQREGFDSSKFNLWPLQHNTDMTKYPVVKRSAIRLIQILYQDADFYKKARDPDLAEKIIDALILEKSEELSQTPKKVPADIYYKMVKGTNTGYPALGEYFKIEKAAKTPIHWAYATTPILRAVLGDEATKRVLAAERAAWDEDHHKRVMPKEALRDLLLKQSNPDFDITHLETFFSFEKLKKGPPLIYIEDQNKVLSK